MFILISTNFNTAIGNGDSIIPKRPTLPPLDVSKYSQLKAISDKKIATIDQLRACQKVFQVLDKHGYSSEFDIIATSLTNILQNTNPSIDQILVFAPLWVACKTRARGIDIPASKLASSLTYMVTAGIKANMNHKEIAFPLLDALANQALKDIIKPN